MGLFFPPLFVKFSNQTKPCEGCSAATRRRSKHRGVLGTIQPRGQRRSPPGLGALGSVSARRAPHTPGSSGLGDFTYSESLKGAVAANRQAEEGRYGAFWLRGERGKKKKKISLSDLFGAAP